MRKLIDENAHTTLNQAEYKQKYDAYAERYNKTKKKLELLNDKKAGQIAKRESIEAFIETLKEKDQLLTEFDEELWYATVDRLIVHTAHNVTFIFKDGTEVTWHI
jgi:DnaJ-domain-containing protein 1